MLNDQQIQMNFANTSNCPRCGKCFCSTAKLQAIDGTPICGFCKPSYEMGLRQTNNIPPPHLMYPR